MFSNAKKLFQKLCSRNISLLLLTLSVAAVFTVMAFNQSDPKTVTTTTEPTISITVEADGKTKTIETSAKTVGELLNTNSIIPGEFDEVVPTPDTKLLDGMSVKVERSFQTPLIISNDSFVINTTSKTVKEILDKEGVILGEFDTVTPTLDTVITEGMSIAIDRVSKFNITENEVIPFETIQEENADMYKGESSIKTEGKNGEKSVVYEVTHTNGAETDRVVVSETIIAESVTKVVEYGTKEKPVYSADNFVMGATEKNIQAVAANCTYVDCKAYSYILTGKTASGMHTQDGIIAVDPKVIPLGTKVYVQSLDGKPDYGYAIAADTGGSIKGNTIDLWVPSYAEASKNGVRRMRVYILPQ